VPATERTVPLVPRRRLVGLSFGGLTSARRGPGSDLAGSRPYQPGDDVDTIDWGASAKLSSARGTDEFVVREKFAEEAPRVVVVCDRRPGMNVFPPTLPWLSKPRGMMHATEILTEAAIAARGIAGYLDFADGEAFFLPPRSQHDLDIRARDRFDAPDDNVALALEHLVEHRRALPTGSFVFVLSDFLVPLAEDAWTRALQQRWDLIPVVIQDPIWERGFPPVGGVVIPFVDPATGRVRPIRMSEREVEEKRIRNERRFEDVLDAIRRFDLEPVVLGSDDRADIFLSLLEWAEVRRLWRGRTW
jgi:uncharacterized protein (DUF58 family)